MGAAPLTLASGAGETTVPPWVCPFPSAVDLRLRASRLPGRGGCAGHGLGHLRSPPETEVAPGRVTAPWHQRPNYVLLISSRVKSKSVNPEYSGAFSHVRGDGRQREKQPEACLRQQQPVSPQGSNTRPLGLLPLWAAVIPIR